MTLGIQRQDSLEFEKDKVSVKGSKRRKKTKECIIQRPTCRSNLNWGRPISRFITDEARRPCLDLISSIEQKLLPQVQATSPSSKKSFPARQGLAEWIFHEAWKMDR